MGQRRDYLNAHPKTAVLVVEVALSSVEYDRTVKGSLNGGQSYKSLGFMNLKEFEHEVLPCTCHSARPTFGFRLPKHENLPA